MALGSSNPFVSLESHNGPASRLPPVTATSSQLLESSKLLANEIRRDDAAMSKELAVLAPLSNRFYKTQEKKNAGSSIKSSAAELHTGNFPSGKQRSEDAVASVEFHEKITMDEFIAKKREVGLVHMSLATKRAEIRKLEEEIDCAEKKLHQQQEQLENTHEKFNNFLKHSNLEQDAAVRRADAETKAKQSKKVEIKKLSARINHVELEIRKAEMQVETCKMYKKFLDDLAKPRWFYDVLIDLRVADQMKIILHQTEAEFELKSSTLRSRFEKELISREERSRIAAEINVKGGKTAVEEEWKEQELVPLQVQLEELHEKLEKKVQETVQGVTENIREEINVLTVEEVRDVLEKEYDESRKPTYYANVEQLLDIFINVEEGNLFLIQNCQELEEELERVASEYMAEKNESAIMTRQRHAQMSTLAEKIRGAQVKLKQLEGRAADLEKHVPSKSAAGEISGKHSNSSGIGSKKFPKDTNIRSENDGSSDVKFTPEQFKVGVEQIITRIFRTLTTGDAIIKSLYASLLPQSSSSHGGSASHSAGKRHGGHELYALELPSTRRGSSVDGGNLREFEDSGNGIEGLRSVSGGGTISNRNNRKGSPRNEKKEHERQGKQHAKDAAETRFRSTSATRKPESRGKKKVGKEGGSGLNPATGVDTDLATAHRTHADQSAGSNMGPVEMLTTIETKLEEYHRTISDVRNNIDENLIQQVMKASDKERRRQARIVHMAKQAQDQEERSRRALERSRAPIVRRTGKPVLPRSRLPADSTTCKSRKSLLRGGSGSDNDSDFDEFL